MTESYIERLGATEERPTGWAGHQGCGAAGLGTAGGAPLMPDDSEIILSFRDKQPPLILSPAAPVVSAEEYVRRECMHPDGKILRHRSGEFLCWTGTHYVPVEAEKVRAFLYAFLRSANCTASDGSLV